MKDIVTISWTHRFDNDKKEEYRFQVMFDNEFEPEEAFIYRIKMMREVLQEAIRNRVKGAIK